MPRGRPRKIQPKAADKVSVHLPGEDPVYSDAELLSVPPMALNTAQRKRQSLLKRRKQAADSRAAKKQVGLRQKGNSRAPQCVEIKRNGEQCGGNQSYGTEHCRHHMTAEEKIAVGLEPTPHSGPGGLASVAQTLPMEPLQMYRRVVEKAMVQILKDNLAALGLELWAFDAMGDPQLREIPGGGLKLYGTSKDGDVIMSNFDDLIGRIEVGRQMIDRVYGKPKQSTVIEGGRNPIKVQPVRDVQHATEVAGILAQVGALPRAPALSDDVIEAKAKPQSVPKSK